MTLTPVSGWFTAPVGLPVDPIPHQAYLEATEAEHVDTLAALAAATLPAAIARVRVFGDAVVSPFGPVWYVRAASEPTHALKVQSADGGWWEIESGQARAAQIDSQASIDSEHVPPWVGVLMAQGYAAPGDGGHARLVRAVSEPAHALKRQSADGQWWELVADFGTVRVRQAGGTEGGAVRQAIQDCIDYVHFGSPGLAARTDCRSVLVDLSAGTCDGPIHLNYGEQFRQIDLRGLGVNHNGALTGTVLTFSHVDAPAIAAQGMRKSSIRDLTISGAATTTLSGIGGVGNAPTLEATWDAALVAAGVTPGQRYAPHCGIAVDPYSGGAPAGAFPDVDFGISGVTAQYDKNPTDGLHVSDVVVQGFEVGLAIQPGDSDANGDHITTDRVHYRACKIGWSVGNSQARNTNARDTKLQDVWCAAMNTRHGRQAGRLGAVWDGIECYGFLANLFEINNQAASGQITVRNPHLESLHRIGAFTGNSTAEGIFRFDGGKIKFRHSATNGVPAAVLVGDSFGTVEFNAVEFNGYPDVFSLVPQGVRFARCRFLADETPAKEYARIVYNATNGGPSLNTEGPGYVSGTFRPFNISTGLRVSRSQMTDEGYGLTDRDHLIPIHAGPMMRSGSMGSARDRVHRPIVATTLAASGLSVARSGRVVSMTVTNATNIQNANLLGMMPGSIIRDRATGTTMAIYSTDTATGAVLAVLLTNYIDDGGGGFDLDGPEFSLGTWDFIETKAFTPSYELVGDVAIGSAVFSNIRARTEDPDYGLAVGDWLWEDAIERPTFNTTGDAEIAAIDTVANTINMSGNADDDASDIPLSFWVRQAPANELTP